MIKISTLLSYILHKKEKIEARLQATIIKRSKVYLNPFDFTYDFT